MSIAYATDESFRELVSSGNVIVDFFMTTCVPCKMFAGVLGEIAKRYPEVHIVKADIYKCPEISGEFGVSAVPTVLFMKDGSLKDRVLGLMDENETAERIDRVFK